MTIDYSYMNLPSKYKFSFDVTQCTVDQTEKYSDSSISIFSYSFSLLKAHCPHQSS